MRRIQFVFILTNFFAALIPGQSRSAPETQHNRCEVAGEIVSADPVRAEGLKIELADESNARLQSTRVVKGVFDFRSVPAGIYRVRAIDRSGEVMLRRRVSLKGVDDYIILHLPYWMSEPPLAHIVSSSELKHKTPRGARKAFLSGLAAEDAGDLKKSIQNFERAVTLDPLYVQAEISLAVQYANVGQFEKAISPAQNAFDISHGDPDAAHVLAMLLIAVKRYVQLENLARIMLTNRQAVSEMHAVLAISLIGQKRDFDEAFSHVELAAGNFPMARLLVANTLVEAGFPEFAAVQINHYLKSSTNQCGRARLERWVASVEGSQPTVATH